MTNTNQYKKEKLSVKGTEKDNHEQLCSRPPLGTMAFAEFLNASSEKLQNGYNLLQLSIRLQVYSSIVIPQVQHGSI